MNVKLNHSQIDIIITTLKNEIESNLDWIGDCCDDSTEKKHFEDLVNEQKEIIEVLKC